MEGVNDMVTERDIVEELMVDVLERGYDELGKCRTDRGKHRWLKRTVVKNDIVIGFWPDESVDFDYFIIKGANAVFSLLFVAQKAGDSDRADHGFKTATVPCLDKEDAKWVQRTYTAGDEAAKLAKLFEMLPPEERDALKVQYGLLSVR